jgi:hypothetical protein
MLDPSNIEDIKSIEKCRQISKEIINYGVSDLEIKKIISLLSLELEDINCMKSIQSILKPSEEEDLNQPKVKLEI